MRATFRGLTLAILAGCVATVVGCGQDDVGPQSRMIGGRCTNDGDCVRRCFVDAVVFPGGYCSVPCASNDDCPARSSCVAREGGICMATCQATKDCGAYGPSYQCARQTSQGAGGDPLACIGG